MSDLVHQHITSLENKLKHIKNNAAPTIPVYDLSSTTPPPTVLPYLIIGSAAFKYPVVADTDYLIEAHYLSTTNVVLDWYINGTLWDSREIVPFAVSFSGFEIELLDQSGLDDPNLITYFRDLKIGTSRGASDLVSDSLATIPNHFPPYTSSNSFWSIVNIGGNDYSQTMSMPASIGESFAQIGPGFLGSHNDVWSTVTFRIAASTITSITTPPLADTFVVDCFRVPSTGNVVSLFGL